MTNKNKKQEKASDVERETECMNRGRQQVSLQENRVNDRKKMENYMVVELL